MLSLKTDENVPTENNEQKNCYFVGILKATDEKSRIRIRLKMSRIWKTMKNVLGYPAQTIRYIGRVQ